MHKNIGSLLLEARVIDQDQLNAALGHQKRYGGRLASICWTLGFADERRLAAVLSYQLGLPYLVLSGSAFPLDPLALVPLQSAKKSFALPFLAPGPELANLLIFRLLLYNGINPLIFLGGLA